MQNPLMYLIDIISVGCLMLISLTVIYIRKTRAGFDDAHHKEQHQQGAADGLERAVDTLDDRPDSAALELLRGGTEELPDFHQLPVPGPQGGVEVVHNPVSASYFYHLISSKNTRGWLLRPSPY